jgi:SAM-dependent methyltransferase
MQEPSWAEGYVVDIGYTHGYYRELAPASLRFVTLLGGVQVVDSDQPFTYYELGCGNGYSSILHAATNPQGQFFGIDFNPTHIHNAQRFAQDAGVKNIQFLEKSFAELIKVDLPEAEIIALHGVHSWVNKESRKHIVEFIRQRLKPGGIVYVSYNCLPGLAQVKPLQRLLFEYADLRDGSLPDRIRRSLEFVTRLDQSGAEYFRLNPLAKARLTRIDQQDRRYLAHEYFNADWSPSYHIDVVKEMASAKLSYVGSAEFLDNFEQFAMKPELAKLAAEVGDGALAETIKDFARNQTFRRDVFTRGASKADAAELESTLARMRFALARPRQTCQLKRAIPAGEVMMEEQAYAPVLDALATAPMTFDELRRAPESARLDQRRLRQAVFGMAALGNILPALPATGEEMRRAGTDKFNRAVLKSSPPRSVRTMLASPVLGAGVAISFIDRLFLNAPRKVREAIDSAKQFFSANGHLLMKDNKPVEDEQEAETILEERAKLFFGELLPFLRQLGVTGE